MKPFRSVVMGCASTKGGGGVKGKILMLCFEWRSDQSPLPEAGGCERSYTSPMAIECRFPFNSQRGKARSPFRWRT